MSALLHFRFFPINFLSIILSKSFQTLRREMIAAVWKMSRVSVWKLNLRKSFENVFIHLRSECFYFFSRFRFVSFADFEAMRK